MGKKKRKQTQAEMADKYALYQRSVQSPDVDATFLNRAYKSNFKRRPTILREDFCGTAAVCCEWTKLGKENVAFGVDLDPEPLTWGAHHNVKKLKKKKRARVHLVEGDVRTAATPPADVIAAENFSYCIFKTRDVLRDYFQAAHRHLAEQGVLVLDLFGGYEAIEDDRQEETAHKGWDYIWHQDKFDPISHDAKFHIHFRFPDDSELREAFTYEWRLWSIPEVRELLLEAGFNRADAYWEGVNKTGQGNGIFKRAKKGTSDPAWNAYIVGVKG